RLPRERRGAPALPHVGHGARRGGHDRLHLVDHHLEPGRPALDGHFRRHRDRRGAAAPAERRRRGRVRDCRLAGLPQQRGAHTTGRGEASMKETRVGALVLATGFALGVAATTTGTAAAATAYNPTVRLASTSATGGTYL